MHFEIWLESQICKEIAVNNSIFNSMDRNYRNYVLKNQIYRKIAKKVQKIVYRRGVRSNDIGLAEYWLLINGKTFSYTCYFLIHLFIFFAYATKRYATCQTPWFSRTRPPDSRTRKCLLEFFAYATRASSHTLFII